jgi:hypothetical protein
LTVNLLFNGASIQGTKNSWSGMTINLAASQKK